MRNNAILNTLNTYEIILITKKIMRNCVNRLIYLENILNVVIIEAKKNYM